MEWLAPTGGWNAWDAALIGVFAVSSLIGLARGLVLEVLSLFGWIAAVTAAIVFQPDVAAWLPVGEHGSRTRGIAALVVVFLVVLIAWGIAARLVSRLVGKTPLKPLDRLLGMAFGFARAALVSLAVAAVLVATPVVRGESWRHSTGARWLETALGEVAPHLPFDLPRRMPPPSRT